MTAMLAALQLPAGLADKGMLIRHPYVDLVFIGYWDEADAAAFAAAGFQLERSGRCGAWRLPFDPFASHGAWVAR